MTYHWRTYTGANDISLALIDQDLGHTIPLPGTIQRVEVHAWAIAVSETAIPALSENAFRGMAVGVTLLEDGSPPPGPLEEFDWLWWSMLHPRAAYPFDATGSGWPAGTNPTWWHQVFAQESVPTSHPPRTLTSNSRLVARGGTIAGGAFPGDTCTIGIAVRVLFNALF